MLHDEADDEQEERGEYDEHERQLEGDPAHEHGVKRDTDDGAAVDPLVALEARALAVVAVAVSRAAVGTLYRAVGRAVARVADAVERHGAAAVEGAVVRAEVGALIAVVAAEAAALATGAQAVAAAAGGACREQIHQRLRWEGGTG